eukprot:TRINITY_DN27539_c0_g1_i1.p1 TRINITY_DN27539_c0_g1~~TRINITY_DN27539_c0_g1_i1.p1  ORF type:complete len:738 (+),score=101.03 TRINITY_DN27539_c0_g1_i1:87-2216(+)
MGDATDASSHTGTGEDAPSSPRPRAHTAPTPDARPGVSAERGAAAGGARDGEETAAASNGPNHEAVPTAIPDNYGTFTRVDPHSPTMMVMPLNSTEHSGDAHSPRSPPATAGTSSRHAVPRSELRRDQSGRTQHSSSSSAWPKLTPGYQLGHPALGTQSHHSKGSQRDLRGHGPPPLSSPRVRPAASPFHSLQPQYSPVTPDRDNMSVASGAVIDEAGAWEGIGAGREDSSELQQHGPMRPHRFQEVRRRTHYHSHHRPQRSTSAPPGSGHVGAASPPPVLGLTAGMTATTPALDTPNSPRIAPAQPGVLPSGLSRIKSVPSIPQMYIGETESVGAPPPMLDEVAGNFLVDTHGVSWLHTAAAAPAGALLRLRWWKLLLLWFGLFLFLNSFFAILYIAPKWIGWLDDIPLVTSSSTPSTADGGTSVSVQPPPSFFWEFITALEFSIETISTIGYGSISPNGNWALFVVSLEAFVAMVLLPAGAGVVFSKLSAGRHLRHTIVISQHAVVNTVSEQPQQLGSPRLGTGCMPALGEPLRIMAFRIASLAKHPPTEVSVRLWLLNDPARLNTKQGPTQLKVEELSWEVRHEGRRRLPGSGDHQLPPPVLSIPVTIVHHCDHNSPLYGISEQRWKNEGLEVLCVVDAVDDDTGNRCCAKSSFTVANIAWDCIFDPHLTQADPESGNYIVDLRRFERFRSIAGFASRPNTPSEFP